MDWQMTAGSDAIRITWEKPDVELLRKTCMRNPLFNTIKCIPNLVIFNSIAPRWFLLKPHHCCSTWPEIWPRNPMTSSNPPQVSLSINDADSYYWWRARQTSHGRVSRVVRISGKKTQEWTHAIRPILLRKRQKADHLNREGVDKLRLWTHLRNNTRNVRVGSTLF